MHPEAHLHNAASDVAVAIHGRINGSHAARDPVVQFGSIQADGGLLLSGSTQAIPTNGYLLAPDVLASHPNLGKDDQVVVIWADRGQARRPVVALVLSGVGTGAGAITAIVQADGTLLTTAGDTIAAASWAATEAMRLRVPPATTVGTAVLALWADVDATRKAYVVAVL